MNENEVLLEMVREVFADEYEFLGEATVRKIIDESHLWEASQVELKGGEGSDYDQIIDVVVSAINFATAIIKFKIESDKIEADKRKAQHEKEIEKSKIKKSKQDEIKRFLKRKP